MITYSDNDAADAIYARVGDAGPVRRRRAARGSRFTVAGHWGNAQLTASDMARLFGRLEELAARIATPATACSVSSVAGSAGASRRRLGRGWSVRFKGGWRPTGPRPPGRAAARRDGTELALAVMTDGDPSMEYGIETCAGIAGRLLSR